MTYQSNMGRMPRECAVLDDDGNFVSYRAVHVRLFNGSDSAKMGHAAWPSAGRQPPTVWKISSPPHPFEIQFYEIV